MKLLSAIVDIAVFVVLALMALGFVHIVFFLHSEDAAAEGFIVILFYPLAVCGAIVEMIKYRLRRNRLFWRFLIIGALAFFGVSQVVISGSEEGGALFMTLLFAPVFAVPLWQLIRAVEWRRER